MRIELVDREENLRSEVEQALKKLKGSLSGARPSDDFNEIMNEMGTKAHELHMLLRARGKEPKHHGYMIKNRGTESTDREFYLHIHPVEDLLAFIADSSANDDPVDQTIGSDFTFEIRSCRWGHSDTYSLHRTATGWDVKHLSIQGPCDKGGHPFLFKILDHDSIVYPKSLDGYMEWLWKKASEEGLTYEAVQAALQELADWVTLTERDKPRGGLWAGY
jgi:hypothetical protein